MNIEQAKAFQELGLHYTADKAEVKRAYSARLKTCNPEKNPEEWMELHRAFQTALSVFTRTPSEKETYTGGPYKAGIKELPVEETELYPDYVGLFDNIDNLASAVTEGENERREEYERLRTEAKRKIREQVQKLRYAARKSPLTGIQTGTFFRSPEYCLIREDPETLELLAPLLHIKKSRFTCEADRIFAAEYWDLYVRSKETPSELTPERLLRRERDDVETHFWGITCGIGFGVVLLFAVFIICFGNSTVEPAGKAAFGEGGKSTQMNVAPEEIYTSGDFEYRKMPDGTAEIVRYLGKDVKTSIPGILEDGTLVTAIGKGVFSILTGRVVFNIVIPDSVTAIDENTFSGLENLITVIISGRNTYVEQYCKEHGIKAVSSLPLFLGS